MVLENVKQMLRERFPKFDIEVSPDPHGREIYTLSGQLDTWQRVIDVGHAAANVEGVRNIVSDLTVKGMTIPKKDYTPFIRQGEEIGVIDQADVIVVGLGITGCGIARELSKYDLKIIAIDMGEDVATAASKANNGGVHMAGLVKPGTLKAELSVRGNALFTKWAEELGFELDRVGHMTYIQNYDDIGAISKIFVTAAKNHDKNPQILDGPQTLAMAPGIKEKYKDDPVASVWMPSQGKVHPYQVCVALIENAAENGVKVLFDCTVGKVLTGPQGIEGVVTSKGIIMAPYLIDAAGIYSDEIAEMAGDRCFTTHNRRGTIAIIDKNKPPVADHLVIKYNAVSEAKKNVESKGGGTDLTPSKNILLGPSATEVPDKEDIETTPEDLEYTMSRNDNPDVSRADIIRIFAGARPADFKEDFVVEASEVTPGLIIAGAIQSPGIGSAPGVAERVEELIKKERTRRSQPMERKTNYNPIRERRVEFAKLSREEQDALIREKPEYGRIVCRCETITEGEILDAIHSPVVPTSIDAIKRRTRAGMGRCQGGFCQPRVLEILARELGKDWVEINLKGKGTNVLKQKNR